MQKWEYLIVYLDVGASSSLDTGRVADRLSQLGREAWELAGIVQDQYGAFAKFIFKRPQN